jgi:hypothetical protein
MVYTSVVYGSIKDSEFPKVFKQLVLLTGSILKDFNYCIEEKVYSSTSDKVLLIRDFTSNNYYTQKMNPPEPWNSNEPNVLSFTKSNLSLEGYNLISSLKKVGYSFTFNGIEILVLKIIIEQEIQGKIWIVIVKSQDYTSDPLKYNAILKSVIAVLRVYIPDLGSVDHTLLRLRA